MIIRRVAMGSLFAFVAACGGPVAPETPSPPTTTTPPPTTSPPPAMTPLPEAASPCAVETTWFAANVFAPIVARECIGCHQEHGPAGHSRLHFVVSNAASALRANWMALAPFGISRIDGTPELLLRVSGRHPDGHPGGALALQGSASYVALETFSADAADPACSDHTPPPEPCSLPPYGPPLLRRLAHSEYDASLTALFGATSTRATSLAADPHLGDFDNHARALVVSTLLADQLRRNAEGIAAQLAVEAIIPCDPSAIGCRDVFIRDFGARAFRRPLATHEVTRYTQLFDATSRGVFESGVRWVVTAMLQSPYFLYRSELGIANGGTTQLTSYEIASELSYFLTGGPPDDELIAAAARDVLNNDDERERQARRLMATPAGQKATVRFFAQWLRLDQIGRVPKDDATYAALTTAVRTSMSQETERFITHVIDEGEGTLPALFTANYSFLDPTLEQFYGEATSGPRDSGGFARTDQPGRRFGLLTQGSLLTVHARANDGSPIHRGALVRRQFLCQTLPPPPPGIAAEPPPIDPTLTTRERYAAHSAVEPCRSCHRLIDPIGFGFSAYDGIGRFRSQEAGQLIDTSGEIVDTPRTDGTFADLEELSNQLATSPDVIACFERRWLRYSSGLDPDDGLACALEKLEAQFESEDLRLDDLRVALVRGEHFVTRTSTVF